MGYAYRDSARRIRIEPMNVQASEITNAQHEMFERLALAIHTKRVDARTALHRAGFSSSLLGFIPRDACLPGFPNTWREIAFLNATCGAKPSHRCLRPHPLDFDLVTLGIRPAALIHGPTNELVQIQSEARILGIACAISMIEITPTADPQLGNYSNLSNTRQIAQVGSSGWRALFISKDPERMVLSWLAEYMGWNSLLGACLGYPQCCIKHFEENWHKASEEHGGDIGIMQLKAARVGQQYDWQMNIFARYTGRVLVDHFPCDFDCSDTATQAFVLAQTLEILCPDVLSDIQQRCQTTVVWTDNEGVLLLNSRHNKPVVTPANADGPIASVLQRGEKVAVTSSGALSIGNRLVDGRMLRFDAPPKKSINVDLPRVEAL